ncbi:sulfite exporter TauE/SafE family protein [Leptospira selangorensis]|uniref:sulfite exporter TauE/SafE family protein n=1 Tax=Leptospira selangorensis TaxID=2484982 RepID=UPI0010841FB7|nr:sulfite exporter TauE/SafE family protein [Leptospira selangorensis]TGK02104.1 sulfite exporter TauE/SafE family protein [Leptospira selangorensis]
MELVSAILFGSFLNGLTGSFHCLGMCGPLAGSLNLTISPSDKKTSSVLLQTLYNLGRLVSYTSIGLGFGFLGKVTNKSLSLLLPAQEFAAWFGAAFILLFGLSIIFQKDWTQNRFFSKIFSKLGSKLLRSRENKSPSFQLAIGFMFGMITGFLPCGILYPAFVMAFATGSPAFGALSMFFFFLGTFPLLFGFGFGLGFRMILTKFGKDKLKLAGFAIILLSISLMLFRMNHTHNHSEPGVKMEEGGHHHHHH